MFTSFNSLVVYTAHSLEEQAQLRQLLEKEGMDYSVSAIDANAPKGFYPAISPELMMTQDIEFLFYVRKKDFDKASALLQAQWHWEAPAQE